MHIIFKCFLFFLCFFLLVLLDICKSYKIQKLDKYYIQNVNKYNNHFTFKKNGENKKLKIFKKYKLHGSLNDYIYKLLIRKFKKQKVKKDVNIYKTLQSAKSSYNIDFLFSCNFQLSEIKQKLAEYSYELKLIDAEKIKIMYLGKKKLVRPIKKQLEAYYILFSMEIYPSMIKEISEKLKLQIHVLRFIITKNKKESRTIEYKENDSIKGSVLKVEQNFFKKIF
ncbi:apicoplast ribosomal protein S6, putative [Plasmodium gallinaceum]|uniref:Apicoplast ribosomal protein S6, putative n=1 Tax=Plasmodium gallinaceum TaxID=5849 RepID=A0A1J1GWQ9_PLAGA|nr:apicoplast ribosomal protein S6, putative [Plasmodium gallinaceum]CRG96876.1 apicoplast ribosomal protein S6, putative [Plasmodium gallinaceum]